MTPETEPSQKSTNEQGYAKNYDEFKKLKARVAGFGALYDPPEDALKLSNLNIIEQNAGEKLAAVNAALVPYDTAVDMQKKGFKPLAKLLPRLIGAAELEGADPEILENLRTTYNRMFGIRAEPVSAGSQTTRHSAAHTSYANKLNDFDLFLQQYTALGISPKKPEFQVAALEALLADLRQKHQNVIDTAVPLRTARDERNTVFDGNKTGLVDVANRVKKYIRIYFGKDSPEYAQVKNLKFKRMKKKEK